VSAPLRLEWLRLQGFGCHRDLEIGFPEGLATWVAPNEAGKSTAVAGLVATVWGLPHLQEPAGFTWGRFRAFDGGPHRGEVRLRRGERRHSVARDFATHHVRVVHHGAAGDETVLEVEHNPNARREASAYLDWLRATLGIDDAALMLSTFVVAQGDLGGPPHRLGQRVQALLAGAGGGTAQDAEARLEAALRACTRRLKGLVPGLSRDGRSDQALELAEARLQGLEARWAAGRAEADAFARIQREAHESAAAARDAEAEARRLRAAADAQRAWVDLREAAVRALRRAGELERAAEAATALEAELSAARGRIGEIHAELADVDPRGLEERLSAGASA
jgi:chromosome segregation protein